MELGAFSISLAVKDHKQLHERFTRKFGFTVSGGNAAQNWLIMKNGVHVIGLFQGMFDQNILTFNPGWDPQRPAIGHVHRCSRAAAPAKGPGHCRWHRADEHTTGPASFVVIDPDGNPILVDQHV
ncbi:MAG: VOC family protein [Kouleothrix sp.]